MTSYLNDAERRHLLLGALKGFNAAAESMHLYSGHKAQAVDAMRMSITSKIHPGRLEDAGHGVFDNGKMGKVDYSNG